MLQKVSIIELAQSRGQRRNRHAWPRVGGNRSKEELVLGSTYQVFEGQEHFATSHLGDKNFCPFGVNNVAQMSRQICSYAPSAQNAGARRSVVPYGHASMLLLGEGSEATEPYNKNANLFK